MCICTTKQIIRITTSKTVFDLTLPAGTYNSRCEITFNDGTMDVDEVASQNNFVENQYNTGKNLAIGNPLQKEIASCGLYDVVGKLIFAKNQLGTNLSYSFPTSSLSDGVYIVRLTTMDKMETGIKSSWKTNFFSSSSRQMQSNRLSFFVF